jgi:hypothetical protein
MQIPTTRVDKATCKQIFRDYGEAFWQRYGHYFDANVCEVVDKMLGCGDLASGYSRPSKSAYQHYPFFGSPYLNQKPTQYRHFWEKWPGPCIGPGI